MHAAYETKKHIEISICMGMVGRDLENHFYHSTTLMATGVSVSLDSRANFMGGFQARVYRSMFWQYAIEIQICLVCKKTMTAHRRSEFPLEITKHLSISNAVISCSEGYRGITMMKSKTMKAAQNEKSKTFHARSKHTPSLIKQPPSLSSPAVQPDQQCQGRWRRP